jgi:glycerophosphoryl diester phosphodiesterase
MTHCARAVALITALGFLAIAPVAAHASDSPPGHGPPPAPALTPLPYTHAHNDYQHPHPLFDALSHRFSSVEADIWLANDGDLLVGHDKDSLQHGRTLEALYLDPLMQLVAQNGGHVYPASTAPLQLLIDVKNTGTATYKALDGRLRTTYSSMLTSWTNGVESPGAIRVIISGDRDRAFMQSQTTRYAAYDGRLSDLGDGTPPTFMPLISNSWGDVFKWKGTGEMPAAQRQLLQGIVAQAHANGQQVRFYGTPDRSASQYESVWREELNAGVDWLNTDELGALEAFLTG